MHVILYVYIFLTATLYYSTEAASAHWSYSGIHGPSNWSVLYPDCAKSRQSPVDIVTANTIFDDELDPIQLTVDKNAAESNLAVVVNNGHTVNLEQVVPVIRVTGGNLHNTFRVAGVHFHWGQSSSHGSEHTINGHHYPLEMHIVSYNEDHYDKLGAAVKEPDGLAVIGLLFQESTEDNPFLEPIVGALTEVTVPGVRVNVSIFDVTKILPTSLSDYYRYLGSLTTPPCYESVTWTVLRQISNVSRSQLKAFGTLQLHAHDGSSEAHDLHIDQNWRPTQPIYNRNITRSFGGQRVPTKIVKSQQPANSSERKNVLNPLALILVAYGYVISRLK